MDYLKTIHVTCALLTAVSFTVRGIWMMQDSPRLKQRYARILPHLIDTLLLLSALLLLWQRDIKPEVHPWLLAKLIVLLVYIALGMAAFRFGQSRCQKITGWFMALAALGCIFGFALTKRVAFWQGLF